MNRLLFCRQTITLLLGITLASTARAVSPNTLADVLGGTLLIGSTTASNRLEQIYYLGTFDPDNRVPPTFFRIRVHGQASFLSRMKFGSGWVPAAITDSLADNVSYTATPTSSSGQSFLATNRPYGSRLQQYGPEGFRNVPDDHRLVLIMGSSPDKFFAMVDQFTTAMRVQMAPVTSDPDQVKLKTRIQAVSGEIEALGALKKDYAAILPP
jgi:hypothetical protein